MFSVVQYTASVNAGAYIFCHRHEIKRVIETHTVGFNAGEQLMCVVQTGTM